MQFVSGSKVIVLAKRVLGEVQYVLPAYDKSEETTYKVKTATGETLKLAGDQLVEDTELARAIYL